MCKTNTVGKSQNLGEQSNIFGIYAPEVKKLIYGVKEYKIFEDVEKLALINNILKDYLNIKDIEEKEAFIKSLKDNLLYKNQLFFIKNDLDIIRNKLLQDNITTKTEFMDLINTKLGSNNLKIAEYFNLTTKKQLDTYMSSIMFDYTMFYHYLIKANLLD